ncbi:MAG: globin domain-containing protein [Myxococcota bacterium]
MALQVELLRSSFDLVTQREPELVHRFYDILFTRYPSVRPMFSRRSRDKQEQMLQEALVAVLDHLEDAPWLESNLAALGAKHVDYGVTSEMYDWVGECLLAALAEAAGPDWNDALREAWTEAYQAIARMMQAGIPATDESALGAAVRSSAEGNPA